MTDQTQDQGQNADLPEGAEVITNIDQMAFVIANWVDNCQQQVRQMLQVPDGQPLTVIFEEGTEGEELNLTGDLLKGFKAGVIAAGSLFNSLPIARMAPAAPAEQPAAADLKLVASNDDQPASGN